MLIGALMHTANNAYHWSCTTHNSRSMRAHGSSTEAQLSPAPTSVLALFLSKMLPLMSGVISIRASILELLQVPYNEVHEHPAATLRASREGSGKETAREPRGMLSIKRLKGLMRRQQLQNIYSRYRILVSHTSAWYLCARWCLIPSEPLL